MQIFVFRHNPLVRVDGYTSRAAWNKYRSNDLLYNVDQQGMETQTEYFFRFRPLPIE